MARSSSLLLFALVFAASCGEPAPEGKAPAIATEIVSCRAGERPVAGGNTCAPVGTTSVPSGFTAAPWGFVPDVPEEECKGATIAVLGAKACEPIDDCTAAFPPANASVAVRTGAAVYANRPDLPVVATLDEALAQAKTGATIAIDEGEFASPASYTKSVRFVGRCAERTAIRGADFGARVDSSLQVGFQSLSMTGAPKVAFLVNSKAVVDLDRVYVHGLGNGAQVGNGAKLQVKRSVFEGPAVASNPNAATSGVYAIYGGHLALEGVEIRSFQNAIMAESVGTNVTVSKSIVHDQVALDADRSALAQIAAFLGAKVTVDASHIESRPGRIAIVGAERLDGVQDKTSPGNPPASLTVTNSSLVHALFPREVGSAIDVMSGATLDLENVSIRHDSFAAIGTSESAAISLRNSVIFGGSSPRVSRIAISALSGSTIAVESCALVSSTQFAIVLDGASTATIGTSLIAETHEIGIADATKFMGAAQAIAIARDGQATIHDSAFVDNEGTGIFLAEASLQVDATVLAGTHASTFGRTGVGITSIDSVVAVRTSTLAKNQIALAIRGGRALLRDSAVTDHGNAIQLDHVTFLQTEEPLDGAADLQVLAAKTTFARNTRIFSETPLTSE